jgi:hypothetical protein
MNDIVSEFETTGQKKRPGVNPGRIHQTKNFIIGIYFCCP